MARSRSEVSAQPSLIAVGTVVWLASELMFFGGLFAAYFTLRSEARVWPPSSVQLETLISAIATVALLLSSLTLVFGTQALVRGDKRAVQRWFAITILLGALFLANQIREFFSLTFGVSSNSYGSIYYAMTGFHAAHVFAGLVLLSIGLILLAGEQSAHDRSPALDSIAYFWHFVDVVWVLLFLTIFVIR
jgi:cytochrome c oxidase subunit 3